MYVFILICTCVLIVQDTVNMSRRFIEMVKKPNRRVITFTFEQFSLDEKFLF